MGPTATSRWIAAGAANPAAEMEDFDNIVRLYWPRIYRFAVSSLGDEETAETVTQDCFWRAWRARQTFRGDCSVRTWLMQIAINLIRDAARSRRFQFWKRASTGLDPSTLDDWMPAAHLSPEEKALINERVRAVWEAAGALSARQKTVFLLRFVEEMELLEIAETTGLSEGAVKSHLFRAVHTVRKRLG
jgi:RNA polymerase sigma-70 factor (ECF subfamily)